MAKADAPRRCDHFTTPTKAHEMTIETFASYELVTYSLILGLHDGLYKQLPGNVAGRYNVEVIAEGM